MKISNRAVFSGAARGQTTVPSNIASNRTPRLLGRAGAVRSTRRSSARATHVHALVGLSTVERVCAGNRAGALLGWAGLRLHEAISYGL